MLYGILCGFCSWSGGTRKLLALKDLWDLEAFVPLVPPLSLYSSVVDGWKLQMAKRGNKGNKGL